MPDVINLPNLVNGVSQQAEQSRFPSQASEQINGMSDAVDGLKKRPPTTHLAKLNSLSNEAKQFYHFMDRDTNERYVMTVSGGESPLLEVHDLAGNAQTVVRATNEPLVASDLEYLQTTDPAGDLRALTVADYTFLLNRSVTAAMFETLTDENNPEALVFFKQSRIECAYEVRVYPDPDDLDTYFRGRVKTGITAVAQGRILDSLFDTTIGNGLFEVPAHGDYEKLSTSTINDGATSFTDVFTATKSDSLLHITKIDGTDFKVEVDCDSPETLFVFKEKTQSFSWLPVKGWAGMKLKITGSPLDEGDEYYVEFVPTNGGETGFVEGTWTESVKGGIEKTININTLPHALRSQGNGVFYFGPVYWGDRAAGDEDTNKAPSFIGRKIKDIFFHRGRLGFIAGESVILSEADSLFNFWRTSVVYLLDSDRIDVNAASTTIALLENSVNSNKKLLLFSGKMQFALEGDDILTPKNARITKVSGYTYLPTAKPELVGDAVYFASKRGLFSGITEYVEKQNSDSMEGIDTTSHVPQYIDGQVTKILGNASEATVVCLADGYTQGLYIYRYFDQGGDRLQSAWSKWNFGDAATVQQVFFIDTILYVVVSRGEGTYLERLNIESGLADSFSGFVTLLDRRVTNEDCSVVSYSAATNETAFTLPYTPDETINVVTRAVEGSAGGEWLPVKLQTGNQIVLEGDHSAANLWFGEVYAFYYVVSRPILRTTSRQGTSNPVTLENIILRDGFIDYDDSYYFTVNVVPSFRSKSYAYSFTGRKAGTGTALTNQAPQADDGKFNFPIQARNNRVTVTITNETPFPCKLLSMNFRAMRSTRR